MADIYYNGVKVTEEELATLLQESQDAMILEETRVKMALGVSEETASAICYLRTRSRWTEEKEQELIERDKAGNPIPLMSVLSGDF